MNPLVALHVVSDELAAYLKLEKELVTLSEDPPKLVADRLDEHLALLDEAWRKLSPADLAWLDKRRGTDLCPVR